MARFLQKQLLERVDVGLKLGNSLELDVLLLAQLLERGRVIAHHSVDLIRFGP